MSNGTGELVTRIYTNFRGVDFRGEEINLIRSPDSLNVWKDYKETESIRTRPSMVLNTEFNDTVYGIYFYNGAMIVHSGTKLYEVKNGDKTVLHDNVEAAVSDSFIYNCYWFFKDGKNYLQYDGETIADVVGCPVTTTIARKPGGGGTTYEDVNLLTGVRLNTFLSDGESTEYVLDAQDLDEDYAPIVKVDDVVVDNYTVDYKAGKITFKAAPPKPQTDGRDNVSVEFSKTVPGAADKILKCTLLQVFDNRVFFSGNPEYPNTLWHCSLNHPTYCSDLDYYNEGMDASLIKGLVAGNNVLWVFREPSQANTTVFYHTPTIDSEYGKIYPSQHSSITTGCIGRAINFNDDIIFFSDRGMEGVSGDITTEQTLGHRSTLVDRKLISETDYKDMILAEWEGYLLVFIGDKAYVADSRAVFTNENHFEYEFFYWDMEKRIKSARVEKGILYLGTDDGVYTLTGSGDLESYWTTPKDKFKYPNMLKTTNKRGCVAEATGDIAVYAKLEDTDFEMIGQYGDVTDYFVSRIKKKKFKDIQLKFYSQTRFSLETVTLEAWIGGYIKR